MSAIQQKNVALILARELASNVATPFFLVDPAGALIFYNEPAERLLGRTFRQAGALTAEEWSTIFYPEALDGSPMKPAELPLMIALSERRPSHRSLQITGLDGTRRPLAVTAFPLLTTPDQLVGAVAIFWELPGHRQT